MVEIAAAAAALLGPYLGKAAESLATNVGESAAEGLKALYRAVRRKFDDEPDARGEEALARLAEEPESDDRRLALALVLQEKAQADASFAQELEERVRDALGAQPVGEFVTTVYGGNVGKLVNIKEVRGNVNF